MNKCQFLEDLLEAYSDLQNPELKGRYLPYARLEPELKKLPSFFRVQEIGRSVCAVPIYSVSFGIGPVKILGWSQMHGNESTTTKTLFDLFNLFQLKRELNEISEILKNCTLMFIPMLNPDGAEEYTRENYNGVDLNRDADKLTQIESLVLRSCFKDFDPDFCFNLHDQRSIFSAGRLGRPATVSFLAPAMDADRSVNKTREKAMKIIVAMNSVLQEFLPGQIGRYDDAFNINCSGDRFQSFEVPTILFEAGHYSGDYLREETRKYMTVAILAGIYSISSSSFEKENIDFYHQIPENQKDYVDILLRNVLVEGELRDVAIKYVEKVKGGKIVFDPIVQTIGKNLDLIGHREINCNGEEVLHLGGQIRSENDLVEGILLNRGNISFKIE